MRADLSGHGLLPSSASNQNASSQEDEIRNQSPFNQKRSTNISQSLSQHHLQERSNSIVNSDSMSRKDSKDISKKL
jgi:hypothetical protein